MSPTVTYLTPTPPPPEFPVLNTTEEDTFATQPTLQEEDEVLMGGRAITWPCNTPSDKGDFNITKAAIKGGDMSQIRSASQAPRLPSEKSYISDGGARGRIIAAKTDTATVDLRLILSPAQQSTALEERLTETLQSIPGHAEKRGYFPEKTFQFLIDKKSVKKELELTFKSVLGPAIIDEYTTKICGWRNQHGKYMSFKKIFAILILSQKPLSIGQFIEEQVSDQDLPLRKVPRSNPKSRMFDLVRAEDPDESSTRLRCFKDWHSLEVWRFEDWQWTTQPPFFYRGERKNVARFRFPDQIPIPFTSDSRYGLGRKVVESGFSIMFKVNIHPEQHGFHGHQFSCKFFAVKCLKSKDSAEFKRETEVLLKFNDETHTHLLSLLATYEQFNEFYLIFPWSEANLEEYWMQKDPVPKMNHATASWMARQCHGIADGLARIHRWKSFPEEHVIGHHGDIKPRNVSWFRDPKEKSSRGTLKITDFGLTRFEASHSTMGKAGKHGPIPPSYRPLENDLHGSNGRSHDIWALGCVYLEFIAWLLGGWKLVSDLSRAREDKDRGRWDELTRSYFQIVDDECGQPQAAVKAAVTDVIERLHGNQNCTEYLHDFLNLIQMDMLHPVPHSLIKESRMDIHELNVKLRELKENCEQEEYASAPACWRDGRRDKQASNKLIVLSDGER